MAQTNADIVRGVIDAFNRGDFADGLAGAGPEFVVDLSRAEGPYAGTYSRDDARRFFSEFAEHWEHLVIEADEFTEAGDDVYGTWDLHVRGRDGIEVSSRVTWVWTVRDGKPLRATMYQQRQEALEAVGATG